MKKRGIVFISIAVITVFLNILAWNSTAFSDWYIAHIFPLWVNTYGRITGIFPFSVGEWLIVAGLVLLATALILLVLFAVVGIIRLIRRKTCAERICRFAKGYYRFFSWVLLCVCLIMTLNCFILYHASSFSEKYFGENTEEQTPEQLITVYNLVAENCNRLSEAMQRDDTGRIVYPGGEEKMADEARKLMAQLGESYGQLSGWYPRPKALLSSDFMCQQYMQGYYFPFSMEANYNDVMYLLNIPATMCHELAHLRGYIYEDEANFIGYLACVQSEDDFIAYSGYMSVLVYLYNDLYKLYQAQPETFAAAAEAVMPIAVSSQVWEDDIFVTEEEWERIHAKELISTEVVDKAADTFIDTTLKLNGVSEGKISYSRVVKLLIQYYDARG